MVFKLPELALKNQDWKIYYAHILNSTATEGVVSHLSGATPKPVNSHELEAWNTSNAVAKCIILEVLKINQHALLALRCVTVQHLHKLFKHTITVVFYISPSVAWTPTEGK